MGMEEGRGVAAGTRGVSGEVGASQSTMGAQLKDYVFDSDSGDQGAGQSGASGPYGPTTIKNGVEYEWSPVTGKYHPK